MRFLTVLLLCLSFYVHGSSDNSLTPGVYKKLSDVQDLIGKQDYNEAQKKLDELEADLKPSFGLALAYQLHGQLYLMQEKNEKALGYFRKSLGLNILAPAQEAGIATTQILMSLERPGEAFNELEPRLQRLLELEKAERKKRGEKRENAEKDIQYVPAQSMIAVATACHLQKHYKKSIPWLRQALKRSDSPKESWLIMLTVALYQDQQLEASAQVLDDLIRLNPKEEYWMQQAGIYQQLNQPELSLRSLETGYAAGYVQKADNQMQLVQLLLNQGMPERAGRILNKLVQEQKIELNERNWRLLAGAWQQSREREKAVVAMLKAADFMQDGSLIYRAAQLQVQDMHYLDAIKNLEQAFKKGLNEKDRAQAIMLAASSAYELNDLRSARRYFQEALSHGSTAANAKSWLDYLSSMEEYQSVAVEG
jgi:tetratricopeptide (TPR) repeat protein